MTLEESKYLRIKTLAREYATPEPDLWTPVQKETLELERLAFIAGAKAVLDHAERWKQVVPVEHVELQWLRLMFKEGEK
jgi:hypothetical protein